MTFTTRFAPSPSGPLHLGHAYSALLAFELAAANTGIFHLRIEDIDRSRARPKWEAQIFDDLHWLGITWPEPVLRQSERLPLYRGALTQLSALGLTYPCKCKRQDIEQAMGAPQEGVAQFGPDGRLYPGTCRARPMAEHSESDVIRLNMELALAHIDMTDLGFTETGQFPEQRQILYAEDLLSTVGDIVLARRDMGTSYHLSVVADDAAQGITHVVRGKDLFEATKIHVVLQKLLGLPTPIYHHHKLIRDPAGKRLAKRDDARAIAKYRADGATPEDVRGMVGL